MIVIRMKVLIQQVIRKHKALILHEASLIHGFLRLLMKQINTNEKWTREERLELRHHIKHLSLYIPALIIFCLPFGMLLVPVLAETLDRRSVRRPR
ncbi:MAG: hypothetical protein KA369_06885 [Spirochaetes bacterium]|nr:hypothetical protein [Spirochaetota bacterium]